MNLENLNNGQPDMAISRIHFLKAGQLSLFGVIKLDNPINMEREHVSAPSNESEREDNL
jgi:hypothetical protein